MNSSIKNKSRVVAVIQARIGSKRLPKKAITPIAGRTPIEWIAYRLSFCRLIDGVVLATADTPENEPLVQLAARFGIPCYAGSEQDLITRLLGAARLPIGTARQFHADAIVRVTGDCPLVDPKIVDKLVAVWRSDPALEYVTNVLPPTFPDGLDVEVLSRGLLERLDREVKNPLYREWLTMKVMEHPEQFRIHNVSHRNNLLALRLTLDYPEDAELLEKIFTGLHHEGKIFSLRNILPFLKKHPKLLEINKNRIDAQLVNNIRSEAFRGLKPNHI